jgi:hypothetical protein
LKKSATKKSTHGKKKRQDSRKKSPTLRKLWKRRKAKVFLPIVSMKLSKILNKRIKN